MRMFVLSFTDNASSMRSPILILVRYAIALPLCFTPFSRRFHARYLLHSAEFPLRSLLHPPYVHCLFFYSYSVPPALHWTHAFPSKFRELPSPLLRSTMRSRFRWVVSMFLHAFPTRFLVRFLLPYTGSLCFATEVWCVLVPCRVARAPLVANPAFPSATTHISLAFLRNFPHVLCFAFPAAISKRFLVRALPKHNSCA